MSRVFLSYSRKDAEFAGDLYRSLQRDGVDCFFDTESIGGEVWPERLEKAIEDCEIFVPILSPDFLTSRWGRKECHLAESLGRRIVPLMHRECSPDGFLQIHQYVDASHYDQILRLLGGTSQTVPLPTDRSALPPVVPLLARRRMPHRSLDDRFVGRVDALWQLHDQLTRGRTSIVQGVGVVYGTGGLGKTQLAVEYVHRFHPFYPGGVFWVEADQGFPRLIEVLTRAAKIEVDGRLKLRDQVEEVYRRAGLLACLVVLDNFPETEPLTPWLPAGGAIHVLVTTRRRDLSAYPHVSLQFLTLEEGVALLNSGERQFGFEARPLVEDVGGLPLALELLRSRLELRRDVDIAALRQRMRAAGEIDLLRQFAEAYGDDLPTAHERSVAATFQLSWDLAPEDGKDVLRVMAHLAPVAVPLRLLRAALGWDDDRLGDAIAALWRLSLVERDGQNQPSAHRLIQGFVRHLPGESRWMKTVTAVESEMARSRDDRDTASYQELEPVVPHAEAVLGRADLPNPPEIQIAESLGWHHRTLGRYQMALAVLRNAVNRATKSLPTLGNSAIAGVQSDLALVLRNLGELAEARDLLRQALASDERTFPSGHSEIATDQSNLALVLKDLGELPEARDLSRQALASDEQTFPLGHPTIAIRQSNLAQVLRDLGELPEARDLLRQALASDEKSFPPGHPSIAIRQSYLALVLKDLGELPEARDLLRQALASWQHSLPQGHPNIATTQSNLATVRQGLGELAQARDLLRQALASHEQSFPPRHSSIATSQSNLATVLHDLGELPEARELMQKAYAASLAQFGPDDHRTKNRREFLDLWSNES